MSASPHRFHRPAPAPGGWRAACERLGFAIYLLLVIGGLGCTIVGGFNVAAREAPDELLLGLGTVAAAALVGWHGYRQWHFGRWCDSLQPGRRESAAFVGSEAETTLRLARVLAELEHLASEEDRPDVWRVQDLRREAATLLQADPELRREFADELAAHPELR